LWLQRRTAFYESTHILTELILFSPLVHFISSRDKNMPPKKLKPNVASDLPCDHAVMPSTTSDLPCDHAGKPSTTLDDPFSYPDVMTMTVTQLKSELNLRQVSIAANSKKPAMQAQLLQSY
jgi:hypothetical protein